MDRACASRRQSPRRPSCGGGSRMSSAGAAAARWVLGAVLVCIQACGPWSGQTEDLGGQTSGNAGVGANDARPVRMEGSTAAGGTTGTGGSGGCACDALEECLNLERC